MNKIKNNLAFFVVFCIFGFLLMMQIKSVKANDAPQNSTESVRAAELSEQLLQEKDKNQALYSELLTAREELEKFREEAANSGDYAKVLASQLERAEIASGQTAVKGPGISVTLMDSDAPNTLGPGSENSYILHDSDLLAVINELRAAGAEALSLNGERLLATSEIRCAGATVSVNNNRYSAPFVIKAIGDPTILENALTMRGGVKDQLENLWGIHLDIEKSEDITINAYSGTLSYKYAASVSAGEGQQ